MTGTFDPWLAPSLPLAGDDETSLILSEALSIPEAERLYQAALPAHVVHELRLASVAWLERVLRPQWLPPDLPNLLLGIPESLNGLDAFLGGWHRGERVIQTAITRETIHVLTSIPEQKEDPAALTLACELFSFEAVPDKQQWIFVPLAGCTLGYQDTPLLTNWTDGFTFLTDGSNVRFSIPKMQERPSPPKNPGLPRFVEPWFPRK